MEDFHAQPVFSGNDFRDPEFSGVRANDFPSLPIGQCQTYPAVLIRTKQTAGLHFLSGPIQIELLKDLPIEIDFSELEQVACVNGTAPRYQPQAAFFRQKTGLDPIFLMDDVLLELDAQKRSRYLSYLGHYNQAFFTFLPEEKYFGSFIDLDKEGSLTYTVKDGEFITGRT